MSLSAICAARSARAARSGTSSEMHERGEAALFEKPIAPLNVVLQQKFCQARTAASAMFETYICKRCGFTEWYAHGVESSRSTKQGRVSDRRRRSRRSMRGPYR